MKAYEQILDDEVVRIEGITRVACPPESRKSAYTKACWLLAKYKIIIHLTQNQKAIQNGQEAIATLREILPKLR